MLYHAYQMAQYAALPAQLFAQAVGQMLPAHPTQSRFLRNMAATGEVFSKLRLTHTRPSFRLDTVMIDGEERPIEQRVVLELPFGSLLHFKQPKPSSDFHKPAVLLAAPLSGHFATLLRDTIRTLLQDHDVYVTDWHNARDVSLSEGAFGLDDYIAYMIRFLETIGPGAHMVAVCQPCVAALASVAIMAEDDHIAQPRSLTLMAGPVDCRVNATEVNKLATSKPIEWFEKNLISHVPLPHAGFMRRVYPGFLQLTAFMSMNLERHQQQFRAWHAHLAAGEMEQAGHIDAFYNEYFAVNDLPAEFYLETVEKVFQTYDLACGTLQYKGRRVNTRAIKRCALLTVEGERDDICAVGQTVAAQDLCTSIRPSMRDHHVQIGVGHYGVFSGKKWNHQIYPRVRDIIHSRS